MRDPISWSLPLGRFYGINVRIHWFFPFLIVGLILRAAFNKTDFPIPGQWIDMMMLLALLWGGFAAGAGYVLHNQDAGEIAAVRLVQATLRPGERLEVRAPPRVLVGKYSAIAHLVVPTGGQYLLAQGSELPANASVVGTAGQFTLYHLAP